jgi:hypothetical protein
MNVEHHTNEGTIMRFSSEVPNIMTIGFVLGFGIWAHGGEVDIKAWVGSVSTLRYKEAMLIAGNQFGHGQTVPEK